MPFGIDRIVADFGSDSLSQFADVTFDDVVIYVLIEEAVDVVEDLGFCYASLSVCE